MVINGNPMLRAVSVTGMQKPTIRAWFTRNVRQPATLNVTYVGI